VVLSLLLYIIVIISNAAYSLELNLIWFDLRQVLSYYWTLINLVDCFAEHSADELEERKVTVLQVWCRWRIQLLLLSNLPFTTHGTVTHRVQLGGMCQPVTRNIHQRRLCSAARGDLIVPSTKTVRYGPCQWCKQDQILKTRTKTKTKVTRPRPLLTRPIPRQKLQDQDQDHRK